MNRRVERRLTIVLEGFEDPTLCLADLEILDRVREQAVRWSVDGCCGNPKALLFSAIELCRKELGAVHSDTLTLIRGAVTALGSRPEYWDIIETCVIESWKECERELGSDHPETFNMQEALACAATLKGDQLSAEMILAETLQQRERALGLSHPDVTTNVLLLAYRICHHREPNRAVDLLRHELGKRELLTFSNDVSFHEINEALADILTVVST